MTFGAASRLEAWKFLCEVPEVDTSNTATLQDAFTALLDDLAKRPLEKPELDCFDPRERFKTERCDSGVTQLAYEERFGELHFQECNLQREFSFHLFYLEF